MPEEVPPPAPQPQPQVATTPKPHNWKKVILTVVFIVGVVAVVTGIYWFLVANKSSEGSDLTGPVPKVTTKTSTESAKESTSFAKWQTYSSDKFNYSINYPQGWSVVKGGGGQCASLGGGSSEDNICFQSPDFTDGSTTGMGIQVEGRPYNADEYLYKCSDLGGTLEECEDLKVAGQDAIKYIVRSSEVKGTLHVEEMYTFPGKNNESSLFLTIIYFRCRGDGNNDCTNKDEADKFISEVVSSFKFL